MPYTSQLIKRLTQLSAVQGAAEERSKAYTGGTVSSTGGDNEEMRQLRKSYS
ncbi:hypothetical protein HY732_03175 [Candidatus Uhrbacteria bacterium]|nr:hypothetical protein [Candidatus Uhrbacteria bacterium]